VIGLSGKSAAPAQGTARDAVDKSIAEINVVQFFSSCSFRILDVPFKYPEKALPLTFVRRAPSGYLAVVLDRGLVSLQGDGFIAGLDHILDDF